MSAKKLPKKGDTVTATPHENDFAHGFEWTVTGSRNDTDGRVLYSVRDSNDDVFECYGFQLEVKR